jgi:glycosyltransferase involved in cell wall biosynthesis
VVGPSQSPGGYEAAVTWLQAFEERQGRPLRVLHVGNVAGNAYLNAKFLRAAGAECHVLSYDYYHPIGTPEWEDGVKRPNWFVQGPLPRSAKYLNALLDERRLAARFHWLLLPRAAVLAQRDERGWVRLGKRLAVALRTWRQETTYRARYARSWVWNWYLRTIGLRITSGLRRFRLLPPRRPASAAKADRIDARLVAQHEIADEFRRLFPARADVPTLDEIAQWQFNLEHWEALVDRYDVVQGYGTDVIRPFVAGKRPYLGYEHGTLRDFTMGDDSTHRMTALAYRSADHVFITNGDCLEYADKLGIDRRSPMIHPVDVEGHRRDLGDRPAAIRVAAQADILLLCPLRHDWVIKGTDIHLRALPMIRDAHPGQSVVLVLCDWGAQVGESKQLIADLGCADAVRWLPALGRDDLIAHLRAADVVLDQIALPHFGATAPQALAAGTPVVMSYRPESTAWIVDEPAPILSAFDPAGVAEAVSLALDPDWRDAFQQRAEHWVNTYHHPHRIVADHCDVYKRLLEENVE